MLTKGGGIRTYDSISRMQGESVYQFVKRFKRLERKLHKNKIPAYPEEAGAIKLLDGLRLDDKATMGILRQLATSTSSIPSSTLWQSITLPT